MRPPGTAVNAAAQVYYACDMCRSIKTLRRPEGATDEEIRAAALQFVRKVSGYRQPAARNQEAFEAAVDDVERASKRLLRRLPAPRLRNLEERANPSSGG